VAVNLKHLAGPKGKAGIGPKISSEKPIDLMNLDTEKRAPTGWGILRQLEFRERDKEPEKKTAEPTGKNNFWKKECLKKAY